MHLLHLMCVMCLLTTCAALSTKPGPTACRAFEEAVASFDASLVRTQTQPPRIDELKSPRLAQAMVSAAEGCLRSRGISVSRVGDELTILADSKSLDLELLQRTGGRAVYSAPFFLAKPYAAASFDKTTNTLFLPHASVISDVPNAALVHEMQHVKSLQLLRAHVRLRHWLLENESTRPDALSIDEIFAYAATSQDQRLTPERQQRSLAMARNYAQVTRQALDNPSTVGWIETHPHTEARPLDPASRRDFHQLLECIEARLPDISECDALKSEAAMPAPSAGSSR